MKFPENLKKSYWGDRRHLRNFIAIMRFKESRIFGGHVNRFLFLIILVMLNIEFATASPNETKNLGQQLSEVPNEVGRGEASPTKGLIIDIPTGAKSLGGSRIEIPPGATQDSIQIQVGFDSTLPGPLKREAIAAGAIQVSDTIILKVTNGGKSDFNKLVKITIPYNLALADGHPPGIFYWDPTSKRYRTTTVVNIDRNKGMVTFDTSHFSSFVAIAMSKKNK
jgi:hypothetical protein